RQIANLSTDAPKDEFERHVHDYLVAHPDVIMQSVNQLEARQRAKDETDVFRHRSRDPMLVACN
ncbi:MAG: hypothetical protein ABI196_16970, partial [Bradyrhizobium sp.]